MKMKILSFSVLIIFAFAVHKGNALRCYLCSSKHDTDCLRPKYTEQCNEAAIGQTKKFAAEIDPRFENAFAIDIYSRDPPAPLTCIKQVTKVDSKEYIVRGCHVDAQIQKNVCDKVRESSDSRVLVAHCNVCNSDSCNSATYTRASLLLLAVACIKELIF